MACARRATRHAYKSIALEEELYTRVEDHEVLRGSERSFSILQELKTGRRAAEKWKRDTRAMRIHKSTLTQIYE